MGKIKDTTIPDWETQPQSCREHKGDHRYCPYCGPAVDE
jgi:ribosomal protein L32